MPNPIYVAAIAAMLGRRQRCPVCAKEQFADRLDEQGRYHCKKCGHVFTRKDLKQAS